MVYALRNGPSRLARNLDRAHGFFARQGQGGSMGHGPEVIFVGAVWSSKRFDSEPLGSARFLVLRQDSPRPHAEVASLAEEPIS